MNWDNPDGTGEGARGRLVAPRLRVLQVVDSLERGGAEKLVVDISETLRRCDIAVTVLSLTDDGPFSVRQALAAAGADVVTTPPGGRRHLADVRRIVRIRSFVKRGRFDVVHTHLFYANVLGCIAARLSNVPAVATLHSTGRENRRYDGLKERMEGLVLRWCASKVIAVGRSVAHAHGDKARTGRMVILVNPVNAGVRLTQEERERVREELGAGSDSQLLLSVGRLSPEKGATDLVRAVAVVRRSHPSVILALAGTGTEQHELEKLVQELDLAGSVRLLGWRDNIPQLMAASDVCVSASHWEGLPMAILEAMAAGLPVVASGVGEVPLLLAEGRGVVVDRGDVAGLADAVSKLLNEPARGQQLGDAARRYVVDHHSFGGWHTRLLTIYGSLTPLAAPEDQPPRPAFGPPCAG